MFIQILIILFEKQNKTKSHVYDSLWFIKFFLNYWSFVKINFKMSKRKSETENSPDKKSKLQVFQKYKGCRCCMSHVGHAMSVPQWRSRMSLVSILTGFFKFGDFERRGGRVILKVNVFKSKILHTRSHNSHIVCIKFRTQKHHF